MDPATMLQILDEVAGLVVRPKFRALASDDVEQKSPGDFVTVADREAEREIVARLRALVPNALLVGEEDTFYSDAKLAALADAELAYTIDPIDGTRNFVNGEREYGMMVAEVRSGVTTRAWIWQPEYQRSYVAELGAGVYRDGERLTPIVRDRLPVGCASNQKYHGDTGGGRVAPIIGSAWSAAFDYPHLLEGVTDYIYYSTLKPWDHLPGALMLRELGGVSRTRDGVDYTASTQSSHLIAAVTPQIWDVANATWPSA